MTDAPASDSVTGNRSVLVSVLTPVFNEEHGLDEVLHRFLAQEDPGGAIEFLFVDGRSTDATRSLLESAARRDPRIHVLDNPRRVIPSGLNVALAVARGEFVARMDAHSLYPHDYLRLGVQRLRQGDVAAVSGPQIAVGRDRGSRRVAAALNTALGRGTSNFRQTIEAEIETDSGFTGMWRRDTILRHGGWDELAYINEDTELASRIREEGGRLVLVPRMAAEYIPRSTLRALWTQYWRYGRGRGRTARLHPISIRRGHALCPALVLTICGAAAAPAAIRRPARAALGVYLLALLGTAGQVRPARDAVHVPIVLAVMHISWGAGYLLGITTKRPAVSSRR